jgi:hypothetical protein
MAMFMTGSDVVKQLCETPTPMRLEKNLIDVDMKFTNTNLSIALVSVASCAARMSAVQVARMIYMYGEGAWLVSRGSIGTGYDIAVLFIQDRRKDEFLGCLKSLDTQHGVKTNVAKLAFIGSGDSSEWVSDMVAFSFQCELVRSCGWVQVGKTLSVLTVVESVSTIKAECEKQTRNIQMVSVGAVGNQDRQLQIRSEVDKYYPLDIAQVPTGPGSSYVHVVVLPTFSEAICTGKATINDLPLGLRNLETFKQYWWNLHAFKLSDEALCNLVKIQMNGNIDLVYPVTCVWKLQPCYVPSYTKLYESTMNSRVKSATEWVRGVWTYTCGVEFKSGGAPLKHFSDPSEEESNIQPDKRRRVWL